MVLLSLLIAFIPDWFEQVDCFEYQTTCCPIMDISVLNQFKSYFRLATDNVALKKLTVRAIKIKIVDRSNVL
jgi:hypothetical protein